MSSYSRRPFVLSYLLLVAVLLLTAVSAQESSAQDDRPSFPDPEVSPDRLPAIDPGGKIEEEGDTVELVAAAAGAGNVEFVGQIGGNVSAVAVMGDYAYVGEGPRLIILDVSDPTIPQVQGQTAPMPGVVRAVAVDGDHAYLAVDQVGLRIIDISDKSAPVEVGFFDTPYYAEDVYLDGDYAYLASSADGLFIIDISDPASPSEVAHYVTPGFAYGVTVEAAYAFVADGHMGLHIVDVSDPSAPGEVASLDTPEQSRDVAVVGSFAYVADGWGGLRIIDITSPGTPVEVGFYDSPGSAQEVVIDGEYAYVADYHGYLRIVNIANANSPTLASTLIPDGLVGGVAKAGNTAFITLGSDGLRTVDVTNPTQPLLSGSYRLAGSPEDVAVRDDYAYVAGGNGGLLVIDISDPANPKKSGSYDYGSAGAVAISGDYAYVASATTGLLAINIANPASPYLEGIFNTPGWAEDVAVAGSYAYVADWEGGLRIIDISNPSSLFEAGFLITPGDAAGVSVYGDYAFISDINANSGLRIINVSDPTAPFLARSFEPDGGSRSLMKQGDDGFLANEDGMLTVDFSDVENPNEIGIYSEVTYGRDVDLDGEYAHLAAGYEGLRIVNVTKLTSPIEVGSYDTPGHAYGVATDGNYSFVADGPAGLIILRHIKEPGAITIQNQTEPDSTAIFDFAGDLGDFSLSNGESKQFTDLPPGDYTIRELTHPDWWFAGLECNTSDFSSHFMNVTIQLRGGEDVLCTFANRKIEPMSENVDLVGQLGGAVYTAAVRDHFALVGEGPRLVVLDINDASMPVKVGATDLLSGVVRDVIIEGNYAYVAADDLPPDRGMVLIFDISNFTKPVQVGHLPMSELLSAVALRDHILYVAGDSYLYIVDVSNPEQPVDTGVVPGGAYGLVLSGNHALVSGWDKLRILDITDLANPVAIAALDMPARPRGVAIEGDFGYVAASHKGLQIVDISDPYNPFIAGAVDTPSEALDVDIDVDLAYVADGWGGLRVIDVIIPTAPNEVGYSNAPQMAKSVVYENGYAIVADENMLRIIDVSEPPTTFQVGAYNPPGLPLDVVVQDQVAYVAAARSGLHMIDLKTPETPNEIGFYDAQGDARSVVVSGEHAYVAAGENGLRIVDISDPKLPKENGFWDTPGFAADVTVSEGLAFVADLYGGLRIIDIADPSAPTERGFVVPPGSTGHVAAQGNYAYITNNSGELRIVDVSNPSSPNEVASFSYSAYEGADIAVQGDFAYLGIEFVGVKVIDVSEPESPTEIAYHPTPIGAFGVAVSGDYAYISEGAPVSGLRVIDIRDHSAIKDAGFYRTPGHGHSLSVDENYTYLADRYGGFHILKYIGYGSITIEMLTEPSSTASFGFTGDLGEFSLESGENKQFTEVAPGAVSVIEGDRTGWYLDHVNCTGGDVGGVDDGVTIQLERGEDIHCTFVNRRYSVTADAGGPYVGQEGSTILLDASGTTHPEMIKKYKWDCANDGTNDVVGTSPMGSTCTYADNDPTTLKLTAVDIFGRSFTDLAALSIENVAPEVDAGLDLTAVVGQEVHFAGSFSDPGTADTHIIKWDFGDGSKKWGTLTPQHSYRTAGQYAVTLTVTDDDGGQGSSTIAVDVVDSAPMMTGITVTPAEIDEGDSFILSGSVAYSNPTSQLSLFVDWGDGHDHTHELPAASTSFSLAHTCIDDDPSNTATDSYTILLKLSDEDGAFSSATAMVSVNNVAPQVEAGSDRTVIKGEPVKFAAVIVDPGQADTHTASWDFGDGSAPVGGSEATHVFDKQGTYTVTVTVEDDDGGVGQDSLTVVVKEVFVIYSPLALR